MGLRFFTTLILLCCYPLISAILPHLSPLPALSCWYSLSWVISWQPGPSLVWVIIIPLVSDPVPEHEPLWCAPVCTYLLWEVLSVLWWSRWALILTTEFMALSFSTSFTKSMSILIPPSSVVYHLDSFGKKSIELVRKFIQVFSITSFWPTQYCISKLLFWICDLVCNSGSCPLSNTYLQCCDHPWLLCILRSIPLFFLMKITYNKVNLVQFKHFSTWE